MYPSSNVPKHGVPAHAQSVSGTDGSSGTGRAPQAIPVRVGNAPIVAAVDVAAVAPSTTQALPRELWWLLPADSRRQLQADHATFGDVLLDPERMIPLSSEAQMRARADYFALAGCCNAGPCFVLSTSQPRLHASASASASNAMALWCKTHAGAPWEVIPLCLDGYRWIPRVADSKSRLASLNNVQFESLDEIVGAMRLLGMREVQPDASAMDEASAPRNCLHRAVLHLVRLCNGSTSS